MAIYSYASPLNLGHKDLEQLSNGEVVIQEKVDGSQISFGKIGDVVYARSRGQQIDFNNPGMFENAVNSILNIQHLLPNDVIYRGEYLSKPKHNTIKYDRIPVGHIILFDVEYFEGFATPAELIREAELLGLESVPVFGIGNIHLDKDTLLPLLEKTSILGGSTIEGIVIKNYAQKDRNGKVLMGKYVSEKFRESHGGTIKSEKMNVAQDIMQGYNIEARWNKAVQHLTESGLLTQTPADIGPLLKEISLDFEQECAEELKELLYQKFRKELLKEATRGFAEWYKNLLAFGES